ncbi:MAG: phosphohydrolase [Parcubacteria group bacterium]
MQGDWMQTYSHEQFWLLHPRPEQISIMEIAHALGNICRFTGHPLEFYSVAQHAVAVSENCLPEHALWGLLHDAHEIFMGDIASPLKETLKQLGAGDVLKVVEERLMAAVAARFNLELPVPADVWYADRVLLATEARDLFVGGSIENWPQRLGCEPLPARIIPFTPAVATHRFLRRAAELGIGVM